VRTARRESRCRQSHGGASQTVDGDQHRDNDRHHDQESDQRELGRVHLLSPRRPPRASAAPRSSGVLPGFSFSFGSLCDSGQKGRGEPSKELDHETYYSSGVGGGVRGRGVYPQLCSRTGFRRYTRIISSFLCARTVCSWPRALACARNAGPDSGPAPATAGGAGNQRSAEPDRAAANGWLEIPVAL
jgi:hypothetical protein